MASRIRPLLLGLLGMLAVAALWEGYKALGPEDGLLVGESRVLPRTTDLAMPHVWDVISRILEPATSLDGAEPLWLLVAKAAAVRSEERRVGKEWVSTGRSRWSTSH